MVNLLKETGGETADRLLTALKNGETKTSQRLLLALINDVVDPGGGFDDNRPLNSASGTSSSGRPRSCPTPWSRVYSTPP
jgi:hypothetical protein